MRHDRKQQPAFARRMIENVAADVLALMVVAGSGAAWRAAETLGWPEAEPVGSRICQNADGDHYVVWGHQIHAFPPLGMRGPGPSLGQIVVDPSCDDHPSAQAGRLGARLGLAALDV